MSVDPLAGSYPWYTPYQFAGNTPIWAIDLDGLEPLFSTEKSAKRVANDINAIFYNEYQNEESKTALTVERISFKQKNPEYGLWDRYGFGNDPEYINKEVWVMNPNENFDWEIDRYTVSLHDLLTLSSPTFVEVFRDTKRKLHKYDPVNQNDYKWKAIYEYGGGEVTYFPKIRLSNRLLDTKIGDKPSNIDYTIGGMFLHEYLYHLHPVGKEENENPQRMRRYFNIATNNHSLSGKHGSGRRTKSSYMTEQLEEMMNRLSAVIEKEKKKRR